MYARHVGNTVERNGLTKGRAEGSLNAIAAAQGFTLICRRPGCGTLVDLWRAKREASQRHEQASYALDQGCGACASRKPGCSKWIKKSRWRRSQVKMATALLEGKRRLIAWPTGPAQSNVENLRSLVQPDDEAHAAAEHTIAKFSGEATD